MPGFFRFSQARPAASPAGGSAENPDRRAVPSVSTPAKMPRIPLTQTLNRSENNDFAIARRHACSARLLERAALGRDRRLHLRDPRRSSLRVGDLEKR